MRVVASVGKRDKWADVDWPLASLDFLDQCVLQRERVRNKNQLEHSRRIHERLGREGQGKYGWRVWIVGARVGSLWGLLKIRMVSG